MPDSFFQSDKKRKRTRPNDSARPSGSGSGSGSGRGGRFGSSGGRDSGSGSVARGSSSSSSFHRPSAYGKGSKPKRNQDKRDRDEDLSSEAEGPDGRGGGGGDVDDMDLRAGRGEEDDFRDDDEALDEFETAAEKRVRLARGYLDRVREEAAAAQEDGDYDAAEIDREIIASRLQKDVSEAEGKIHTFLAPTLASNASFRTRLLSTPSHAPTSTSLTPEHIYVSTKRGVVFRYALSTLAKAGQPFGSAPKQVKASNAGANANGSKGTKGKNIYAYDEKVQGHKGEILCVSASEDGRYVVTGGRDRIVGVWKADEGEVKWVAGLRGHKDAVTSIVIPALNNPSHHILSASLSRHLALQSLSTLSTIDTFFGHQDSITSVHAIKPQTAVTAGSRDRTCRWWKVEEDVQLVLRGGGKSFWSGNANMNANVNVNVNVNANGEQGAEVDGEEPEKPRGRDRGKGRGHGKGIEFVEGSLDVVCMLDDQHFVSGGDSGTIALWSTGKKKPIFTVPFAHGVERPAPTGSEIPIKGEATGGQSQASNQNESPRWISSLAALRGTDLFASGSWDGSIRLWALDLSFRSFRPVGTIGVAGFVNGLHLLSVSNDKVDMKAFSSSSSSSSANASIGDGDGAESAESAEMQEGTTTDAPEGTQSIVITAAISQEPRLGRWMRIKDGVKNGVLVGVLPLPGVGKRRRVVEDDDDVVDED